MPFVMQTPDPQRGVGCMPKRGCDVSTCEISRFYRYQASSLYSLCLVEYWSHHNPHFRLNNNGFAQVIPFKVPRKSELFQVGFDNVEFPLQTINLDEIPGRSVPRHTGRHPRHHCSRMVSSLFMLSKLDDI